MEFLFGPFKLQKNESIGFSCWHGQEHESQTWKNMWIGFFPFLIKMERSSNLVWISIWTLELYMTFHLDAQFLYYFSLWLSNFIKFQVDLQVEKTHVFFPFLVKMERSSNLVWIYIWTLKLHMNFHLDAQFWLYFSFWLSNLQLNQWF